MFSVAGAILGALACLAVGAWLPMPGGRQPGHPARARAAWPSSRGSATWLALVLAIAAIAAVFSYFPARRGGRIRPVEALASTF